MPSSRSPFRGLVALVLAAALALAGLACEDTGESAARPAVEPVQPEESPSWEHPDDVAERCVSDAPADVELRPLTLRGPGLDLRAAAVLPGSPARAAVVLLPQTGAHGLCGWLPYAAALSSRGIAAVSLDLCEGGESRCDAGRSSAVADQVDLAGQWLRREAGASTVVVVGASMGGSQAVRATAQGAAVDAWVDLSGPSAWDGTRLLDVAGRLRQPGLVVHARSDGAASEFRAARTLAERAGAQFLGLPGGHGWELVLTLDGTETRTGRAVAEFVLGARRHRDG
ncbi:alpha/beta hydrolase [Nocardioides pantholopis]|uniref:alpha/beta hydrolase n=1 Tax=Nocardioides pantholopis TaxID=2483798 RepID=UPI000F08E3F7|nr:hypothetical protein [Nocardioides pantholopis]